MMIGLATGRRKNVFDGTLTMHTITRAEGRYKMPPGPASLPPEDITMIREWIRQGAP
jgi:hypothetical protein